MCGIAGFIDFWDKRRSEPGARGALLKDMCDVIRHRGPDAGNIWTNAKAGIAFGHRRLSILDLSEAGAQPMHSACGRYSITFNGEIYNYRELRDELAARGYAFRSGSDTEVLLQLYADCGADMVRMSPQEFGAFMVSEMDKWGKVVKESGIKAQ